MQSATPGLVQLSALAATLWLAAAGAWMSGCDRDGGGAPPAVAEEPSHHEPTKQPLPAFEGFTLEGERFTVRDLLGRRALLFFFNPEMDEAGPAGEALAALMTERAKHNFQLVGIALGTNAEAARSFAESHHFDFPVVEDTTGAIAQRLRLRQPLLFIGIDSVGDVSFMAPGAFPGVPHPAKAIEAMLRESLRLPTPEGADGTGVASRPRAPDFKADRMRKDEPFELSAELGRPGVVIFFLDTCQHCHQALRFLKEALAQIPEDERPFLIGVSVRNRPYAVASALKETGLDFFDVVFDPDYAIRDAYGVVAGVPDIFVIDPEGRIAARVRGWNEARDPALMRMWLAEVSGQPVPMLLHTTGYSGNEACAVCHPQEYETWQLTQHAGAYNTLVRHGADQNEECVSCHVVGWGQPGGYEPGPLGRHLENVGCESCHGRGGPHLSPSFVKDGNYEGVCRTCHDPKHSLGFEYATFLPQISHAANAPLLQLPPEQRERILAERGGPRSDLLPTQARYVGSEACRSCHEAEYATWAQSGHAKSLHSLEAKGEASNAECLACHTTAMGRNGGFPKDGKPADHADLARVGCESCHGPGGDHVGVDSTRIGTIVSLGDKCDSCVILQICGTCHDDANDPGFEFEVEAKIEAQRHGTIEPAASRQPASVGSRAMPRDTDLVAHGFARRDSQP